MVSQLPDRMVKPLAITIGSIFLAGIVALAMQRPVVILAALLLMLAGVGVWRFPIATLGVLLFVQPFNAAILAALAGRAHISPGPLAYSKDALILVLFARAVAKRFLADRRLPVQDPGDNVLLFYILFFVVTAILSPPRPSVYPALGRYVEGPLLLLTIRFLRPSRRELLRLAGAMLAAATIIGVAAVIERFGPRLAFQRWYGANPGTGGTFVLQGGAYRAGSFLYDPLILGFYLAAVTPFAVGISIIRRQWRPVVLFVVAACGTGLFVTLARSAYIGAGIGILVALSMAVRNPRIRISLVGLAIVIGGTVTLSYLAAGNATLIRSDSNTAHQQALTRDETLLFAQPFGYGLGTTDRFRSRADVGPGQLGATESSYLATALEGGIQGLVLYLIALFVTAMRVRSVRLRARRAGDLAGTALAAGAIGAILAVAIAGFFLGVHELVVEAVLWGAPGLALAWPIEPRVAMSRERADSVRS